MKRARVPTDLFCKGQGSIDIFSLKEKGGKEKIDNNNYNNKRLLQSGMGRNHLSHVNNAGIP